uniref:C2H2-type domain-containing protein n=1 Tax=Cyprinus carpio TaxID=7962 RepID=A0A8C1WPZ2_CYPCA
MEFIKEESEDIRIEETFSLKHEDAEEQTDLMALKEERKRLTTIEEKDQYERLDFITVETSMQSETSSSPKNVQKTESNSCFTCHQCGKSFKQKYTLQMHMNVRTGGGPFKCHECGKRFSFKENLKRHMNSHTGMNTLICPMCGACFANKQSLTANMKRQTGEKPVTGDQCGMRVKGFTCHQCGQRFPDKRCLNWHEKVHSRESFTCHECGKSFRFKGKFKVHMRIHTGEKPFTCTHCGKSFNQKITLQIHTRLHTGEKPFTCLQCKRSFTYQRDLKRHLQTHSGKKLQFLHSQISKINIIITSLIILRLVNCQKRYSVTHPWRGVLH